MIPRLTAATSSLSYCRLGRSLSSYTGTMLPNSGRLAGCTIFITGASRGIGKAIALKAARDGANVVIAAKTAEPHPKLPGTIYTAAEEIEAVGGKALPCIVDVRDEKQISEAVEKAVSTFGGIDILVNNASAISLTNTVDTSMKKVDLMMGINTRGTYLTSKLCIPYLKRSKVAHILNLSPPLNLNPIWFKNHCAYTIAKYGMSMCVLGMAEELRGEIAVNALWPRTAIHTAAMDLLGGSGVEKQCRTADIMADAAYSIFTKPKSYTGNFVIDEELLKTEGIKDFDVYAVSPGHPLLPDFFLDENPDVVTSKLEELGGKGTTSKAQSLVEDTFKAIGKSVNEDAVKSVQGIYQFILSGAEQGTWYLDLKTDKGSVGKGEPSVKADVVMSLDSDDFVKMFTGKLKPTMAFMGGKLKIKGNMALAMKLEVLLGRLTSKL
ncbi:PREDICTED: hydroxysteroid dehydrogenase-like protein 2 [Nanorana parkeri]|uniref:hydroxysteroid dehydrogenase-like protein 2 n=1 Tax=Nanorana parkeri TaxID=125878 RepID=UPI000854ACC2|nr:PREDICTED: hydroxysteroid dehydrogenase-like protein 2 [Nanorana parkeri]